MQAHYTWAALSLMVTTVVLGSRGTVQARISAAPAAATTSSADPTWDTFVVDIKMTRQHLDSSGQPIGNARNGMSLRWERTRRDDGWRSTYWLGARDPQPVYTQTGVAELRQPPAFARIEDDETGEPVRFYDVTGRQLRLPTSADIHRVLGLPPSESSPTAARQPSRGQADQAGGGWLDNFLNPASQRDARRSALVERYGSGTRYRSMDRFLQTDGDVLREVLVDPISSVPLEVNVLQAGMLQSHTAFEYAAAPDRSLTRRRIHTERVRPGTPGERDVLDLSFENVRFERRGGTR